MTRVRTRYVAYCLRDDCDWTSETDTLDLDARKHTGEGPYAKKPGPHHPTAVRGEPVR